VPRVCREDGIALPTTILVITLVTIMISALFVRVQTDRRIGESGGYGVDALTLAQGGLDTYLGTLTFDACDRPQRPPDGDSVRINLTGGFADVVAHVVRKPSDTLATWMYAVRSTGHVIVPTLGSDPQAERTVAQFAEWLSTSLVPPAAFTAANELLRSAGGITLEFKGVDQAAAGCTEPDVPAMRVPAGSDPTPRGDFVLNGATPNIEQNGTRAQVADETGINWTAVTGGGLLPDTNDIVFWDMTYPVMMIVGDAVLNTNNDQGFGTLIVTGDLTVQGNYLYWYGIVLVGGRINFNATEQLFDGFVVSGLNEQIGVAAATGSVGTVDRIDIDYDSQYVRRALKAFAGFAPISNAWIDNWATY
jgi:hypothetical protein